MNLLLTFQIYYELCPTSLIVVAGVIFIGALVDHAHWSRPLDGMDTAATTDSKAEALVLMACFFCLGGEFLWFAQKWFSALLN
jgi:hypothetical protein